MKRGSNDGFLHDLSQGLFNLLGHRLNLWYIDEGDQRRGPEGGQDDLLALGEYGYSAGEKGREVHILFENFLGLERITDLEDPAGAFKLDPFLPHGFIQILDGHNPEFMGDHGLFQIPPDLIHFFGALDFEKHVLPSFLAKRGRAAVKNDDPPMLPFLIYWNGSRNKWVNTCISG